MRREKVRCYWPHGGTSPRINNLNPINSGCVVTRPRTWHFHSCLFLFFLGGSLLCSIKFIRRELFCHEFCRLASARNGAGNISATDHELVMPRPSTCLRICSASPNPYTRGVLLHTLQEFLVVRPARIFQLRLGPRIRTKMLQNAAYHCHPQRVAFAAEGAARTLQC